MGNAKIHQIRIDFQVTPEIERYVYVYLIEAKNCYLVDSGVYGCEKQILQCLEGIGRTASDIKGIVLTHAHPDHIGSAAWFQEHTDCRIYASAGEKRWIENIDLQFQERPIPVQGDIPIIINELEMKKTLQRFKQITDVNTFYPAWDMIYSEEMMIRKLQEANELLDSLKQAVEILDVTQTKSVYVFKESSGNLNGSGNRNEISY